MSLLNIAKTMPQNKDSKKTLRILFDEEKYDYIYIPRIQRDYAQGRNDEEAKMIRENILDDVSTCNPLSWGIVFGVSEDKDFEDGSRKKCFVPIDGQQRLTTLFLLNLYGAKRHKINFNYLSNFNYETRNASKDFIEALVSNWDGENNESSLKKHIINQGWFINYWSLDPTVDAILNTLSSIDMRFSNHPEIFYNLDRISFEFLDLKSLDLNETLYLKMNSRGRKLSQFDKIKSEIDKILSINEVPVTECNFELYDDSHLKSLESFSDKWKYCIDRKWSDLFWNKDTHNFDIAFLAFLVNYLIPCAGEKYAYIDNLLKIDFSDGESFLPWKYLSAYLNQGENARMFLKNISNILNKIIFNAGKTQVVPELLAIPNTYPTRAMQFGLLCYAGNDYTSKEFEEWRRFVYNYSINTVEDRDTFFAFSKRIIEEFSERSTYILSYLSEQYSPEKFEREQLNEEYFKASCLLREDDLAQAIREAEKHPMLNGRIRPLIADKDHYDENSFLAIWNNFIIWFGMDGGNLRFEENSQSSLAQRVTFATAFTKNLTQMNQLFHEVKCLDFAGNTLKEKLKMQRFEPVFRRCLLTEDLNDIDELHWENPDEIEGIQTKRALLQNGVIEGILKYKGGDQLRFRWYHNCSCFYPTNGRNNDWRIGFDRINNDPGWTRNRNHVLNYLQSKGYEIKETRVSKDESVALWWGSDIEFINQKYPEISLMWDVFYNVGIIRKSSRTWIKRRDKKEGQSENYLFCSVGKTAECIESELSSLICEFVENNSTAQITK